MKKRGLSAVAAALCCAGAASLASAQCANYTITNPGPATFVAGTISAGSACDDCMVGITFPFPVTVYGGVYTSARASSNGNLQFNTTAGLTVFTNACLPTTSFSLPVIMPHWDDLRTDAVGSGIFTATLGAAPNRQFVVEWRATLFSGGGPVGFEIIFSEGQNHFDVVYGATVSGGGVGATAGVQASNVGPSTQFSCDTASLSAGLSLRYNCVAPAPGACCAPDGTCSVILSSACTSPNLFAGDNSACTATDACPLSAVGACCSTSGVCTFVASASSCTGATSTYILGGTCTPNACTPLLRACCSSGGGCSLTTPPGCTGTTQTFLSTNTTCGPTNPCAALLGSCCDTTTSGCTNTTTNGCPTATATFLGAGTVCGVNLCANTGACCSPAGVCTVTTQAACPATSFFQMVGVACGPTNPCLALSGACCTDGGICAIRTVSACAAPNIFIGISTACDASGNCPATVRACCNNATGVCVLQTAACATGTTEIGNACLPTPCPSTPPIAAAADFGDPVGERGTVVLSVTITTPGNNPPSASYTVTTNASTLGGPAALALADDGLGVDLAANDRVFAAAVNVTAAAGAYPLTFTVTDDQMRSPTAAVTTTVNVTAINGACCGSDNTCSLSAGNACVSGGGTFQGPGTVCTGPFYNLSSSMSAFASIAATGTQLAIVSNCDDCTENAAIGFTFNFLGADFAGVGISSNGNLQFVAAPDSTFTNVAIPSTTTPNNMLAPLWDDFNPGGYPAGDVYILVSGTAPNRTCTISWENVSQFGLTTPGDSNNFQVVLFEGSNNFEFRYGALSTLVAGTNDFGTVGFENSGGTAGRGIERNTLHGGNTAIRGTRVDLTNPCAQALTGACCSGATCSITDPPSCSGPNQSFRGLGSSCNAPGNNTTPCCKADFNHVGGVTVQDIFDFLAAYFSNNAQADINGGGVSVQDIFDFLAAYFAGCA